MGRTLALCLIAACYTPPQPDCGFVCGPLGECPESYACGSDDRCHRVGTPVSLICGTVDAGPVDVRLADAPPDGGSIDTPPADVTSPMLASSVPADNDTGVALDATITVVFDEPVLNVDATTFTAATGATPYTGVVTATSATTYVFTPDASWPATTQIDVTLASGITDLSSNALATTTFDFTTTN